MKTNQNTFSAIIAVLAVIFTLAAFAACPQPNDDNKKQEPKCECPNGQVHYFDESCCERTDCACKTDFRITNEINTFIIPIFKSADVEASDARVKAANLVEYFTRQSIDDKEDIIDYVKEIEIVKAVNDVSSSNKGVDGHYKYIKDNESGKIIIEVQFDSEPTYDGWVLRNAIAKARANGDIAQLRQPAAIRLAKAPFDAKAFAKLVAAQVRSGRARA